MLKGMVSPRRQRPRYRARLLFYFVSVTVFATAAAVAVLVASGYTVSLAGRTVSRTGLVVLNSTPSNAYITVNNKLQQQRTNARVKLSAGSYHIKVDRPGVIPWEKDVRVEAGQAQLEENILLFSTEPEA